MEDLLDKLARAGMSRWRRYEACEAGSGHHKDDETMVNGKPAWKCRCGFAAPTTAKIWIVK